MILHSRHADPQLFADGLVAEPVYPMKSEDMPGSVGQGGQHLTVHTQCVVGFDRVALFRLPADFALVVDRDVEPRKACVRAPRLIDQQVTRHALQISSWTPTCFARFGSDQPSEGFLDEVGHLIGLARVTTKISGETRGFLAVERIKVTRTGQIRG